MNEISTSDYLAHFGVKGMRWGVRKDRPSGVSAKINRDAAKDAKEFARAKQFYGEGAGTRRKLIKAKVESKSKHSASYKKAFDHHLANQDMGKHSDRAVSERKRRDRTTRTKQRAGYIARTLTGQMGTQAAFTAATIAGVAFLRSPKGQATMRNVASRFSDVKNSRAQQRGADFLASYIKRNG